VISRLFAISAAAFLVSSASASTILNFAGTFTADDQEQIFQFTVSNPLSTVSVFTTSFAAGGFIPVLSLFSSQTGAFETLDSGFADNSDAIIQDWPTVPNALYTVVLTEYDNLPAGLNISDGFTEQGNGNFTSNYGPPGPFREPFGSQLTGDWAVTFTSLDPTLTVVPEPGAGLLAGAGVLLLLFLLRRRRTAVQPTT